jgi:hypothetical protein
MEHAFHNLFLAEIKRLVPEESNTVKVLMQLLHASRSNVYKKLNGNIDFSTEEILTISQHFGISLDQFAQTGIGEFHKVSIDYSISQGQEGNPAAFIRKLRHDLERTLQLPQPSILYATNEAPIFHSLMCPKLLAFKLYVWSRTNWQIPDMMRHVFDPAAFYQQWPEVEAEREAILSLYQQIPSKEYWPRQVLSNILNQIRYYAKVNLFQDPKMPALLHEELRQMLETCENQAFSGQKNVYDKSVPAASYGLYLNEIAYTNNIVLVKSEEAPIVVYITVDNPNFLRSSNPVFCQRMLQWIGQIEACSFPTVAEQHRMSLFGDLRANLEQYLE